MKHRRDEKDIQALEPSGAIPDVHCRVQAMTPLIGCLVSVDKPPGLELPSMYVSVKLETVQLLQFHLIVKTGLD
jgi:hypothetical protein